MCGTDCFIIAHMQSSCGVETSKEFDIWKFLVSFFDRKHTFQFAGRLEKLLHRVIRVIGQDDGAGNGETTLFGHLEQFEPTVDGDFYVVIVRHTLSGIENVHLGNCFHTNLTIADLIFNAGGRIFLSLDVKVVQTLLFHLQFVDKEDALGIDSFHFVDLFTKMRHLLGYFFGVNIGRVF